MKNTIIKNKIDLIKQKLLVIKEVHGCNTSIFSIIKLLDDITKLLKK